MDERALSANQPARDEVVAGFAAARWPLFWMLLRGYGLMVPTIGIYRFWLTTRKRRFYWSNTLIGGEPLDYTGSALQLLTGFFFAVAFFLPVYIAFFYFATQGGDVAVLGYGLVGLAFWFMTGYAIYRARDFRLSRTLWRGIRFDQRGNAWAYALKRFLWSILVLLTLGLAYPFMAASLWRYRWNHCFYGDRRFGFSGSWKLVAWPFYRLYFGLLILGAIAVGTVAASPAIGSGAMSITAILAILLVCLAVPIGWCHFRARTLSRLYSGVWLGPARLAVSIRARALFGQLLAYGLAVLVWSIIFLIIAYVLIETMFSGMVAPDGLPDAADIARLARSGWVEAATIIGTYLAYVGGLALLGEVIFGYGHWVLIARGARIAGFSSLDDVRATPEDRALVGEGLADALNVGAY
jgi:uncharacterized membrane protein YjgN (DUF898 family)